MTKRPNRGFTLVEVLIASVILTIVSLSLVGVMGNLGAVATVSREMTVANHLAQEKVDSLRAMSFYQIMVTSSTSLETNFSPPLMYDDGYYPPERVTSGGTTFIRHVFIEKVDTPSGVVENMGYPHPDTGLKRIQVLVTWQRKNGTWKKTQISSLASNPAREALDKRIWGYVTHAVNGTPVAGALVQARRNPGWGSVTDSSGYYSFQATDADMILISGKLGFYDYTSTQFNISYGDNRKDFQMAPISVSTVTGFVVTNVTGNLIISQINCKWHATNDVEFVELYNGSTNSVNIAGYTLTHVDKWGAEIPFSAVFISSIVPAQGYYLFVGSQFGTSTTTPSGFGGNAYYTSLMSHSQQGGVILKDASGNVVDKVAWGNTVQTAPAAATEGNPYNAGASAGIDQGNTLCRKVLSTSTAANMTPTGGAHINFGNAWDSQDNNADFVLISTAAPRNAGTAAKTPLGGKVLGGAVISGNDPLSAMITASSSGYFLIKMATGAYKVEGSSGSVMGDKNLTLTVGTQNIVILATSPCTYGFASGLVKQYGTTPFDNMIVQADPGGIKAMSNASGRYTMALPADEDYFFTGNPDFYDSDWNTAVTPNAYHIDPGVMVDIEDLNIWKNGFLSGRITTNGVDGLPGVAVVASGQFSNGNTALTDSNGNFTISGLRLVGNPYTIFPVLVEGQASSPSQYTGVDVVQGSNSTGYNFQIAGAYVTISGTATYNGSAIGSGVSILASTMTISASNPPDITFAVRGGGSKYYQAVTDGSGRYTLSVVGGATYNLVAWYTASSSTTARSIQVTVPTNLGTSSAHFAW